MLICFDRCCSNTLSPQDTFKKAAEEAKGLPDNVTNDDKLVLYGLYKQATVGDVEGEPLVIFEQLT